MLVYVLGIVGIICLVAAIYLIVAIKNKKVDETATIVGLILLGFITVSLMLNKIFG